MRIVFLGTPDFAVPSLCALAQSGHCIAAVVTQPDRPGNRGQCIPCAVKAKALELGLPVLQYEAVSKQGVQDLRALAPDLMITCAFGQILSDEVLAIAPHGILNVHGSLLPLYRGASPIQSAVLNGDAKTGVTIMRTAHDVDSGDILLQCETEILPRETAGELFDRLSELGAQAIVQAVQAVADGTAHFTPQDHSRATFCRMLHKQSGLIDWTRSVREILCHIDGMTPWPSAYTYRDGKMVKIWKADGYTAQDDVPVGRVIQENATAKVRCQDGYIVLHEVQPEGKKRMPIAAYLAGHPVRDGENWGV